MYRQTGEHGHAGAVQEVSERERLRRRVANGVGEGDQVDRILSEQDEEHPRRNIDNRQEIWRESS